MRCTAVIMLMCLMLTAAVAQENPAVAPDPAVMRLEVVDASVAPAKAGGSVAVRMVLANPTPTALRLVGASTPLAGQTLLQTYAPNGQGLMQVQELKGLPLPAKTEVLLLPGVLELQLVGLTADLQPGLELPLKLKFADGTERTVRINVEGTPQ